MFCFVSILFIHLPIHYCSIVKLYLGPDEHAHLAYYNIILNKVNSFIGAGEFSVVVRAYMKGIGNDVAVKFIHISKRADNKDFSPGSPYYCCYALKSETGGRFITPGYTMGAFTTYLIHDHISIKPLIYFRKQLDCSQNGQNQVITNGERPPVGVYGIDLSDNLVIQILHQKNNYDLLIPTLYAHNFTSYYEIQIMEFLDPRIWYPMKVLLSGKPYRTNTRLVIEQLKQSMKKVMPVESLKLQLNVPVLRTSQLSEQKDENEVQKYINDDQEQEAVEAEKKQNEEMLKRENLQKQANEMTHEHKKSSEMNKFIHIERSQQIEQDNDEQGSYAIHKSMSGRVGPATRSRTHRSIKRADTKINNEQT
ncbi:unnamed protein product, partial [Didymodactylos carnosus]